MGKPIENEPKGVRLPPFFHAINNNGQPYRVVDGDTWENVAERFVDGDTRGLIWFNFMTNKPNEVNWYLRRYVGCKVPSPSGNNWTFSKSAVPGIIYIPPREMDFEPEEICGWDYNNAKQFLLRLDAVAKGIQGEPGIRLKRFVQVIARAGYPKCLDLWYYNPGPLVRYVSFHTGNAERREMTKHTSGAFPFSGDSGVTTGEWQIKAVKMLFDEFACGFTDVPAMKHRLEWLDDQMWQGWHAMELVDAQSSQGGGSGFGPLVWDMINHVRLLATDRDHLYWAYNP